jgi:hypothetical protein
MKVLLHPRSRHGNANAVEICDSKEENEQSYDAVPTFAGADHRARGTSLPTNEHPVPTSTLNPAEWRMSSP